MFEWFDVFTGWFVRFALIILAAWVIAAAIEDKSHYRKTARDKNGVMRITCFTWLDYLKTFNVWAVLAIIIWLVIAIPAFGSLVVH